ncbi:hypothetical protein [Fundidesulfovibrio putealis]|uniref:hypothetical protein n=1 Tax=Fundidesulfovibrio putealis TaxID=270496 RepID=UPI0012EBF30B|nr:hypothetical protein [Fundidesulfovibrio putealis]
MRVQTNQYEWSHGHRPRGFGMWAIRIGTEIKFFSQTTFSKAVKAAKQIAKEQNLFEIEILP